MLSGGGACRSFEAQMVFVLSEQLEQRFRAANRTALNSWERHSCRDRSGQECPSHGVLLGALNEKAMQEEKRSWLVTSILILNSILLGLMVVALLCALAAVSLVVDQEVGLRSVTEYTQWVFDHTPRHPFSMISVSVGVTATCLFLSLTFPPSIERGQRTAFHLLFIASFCLIAASYFFFSITGIATSLVRVYGDLYMAGSTPPVHAHSSQHLHWSSIDPRIWVFAAGTYSLALLIIGVRLRRRWRESNDSLD